MSKSTLPAQLFDRLASCSSCDRQEILELMNSDELEILGALYDALSRSEIARKIQPRLTKAEINHFLRAYFKSCIVAGTDGEWADSRFSACWDLANWLRAQWTDLPNSEREKWIEWVEPLLLSGDGEVASAIETGFLEHLSDIPEIRVAFSPWLLRPSLRETYVRCLLQCAPK